MQGILFELVTGFALGLSLAAPPGPMNALMANESVKSARNGMYIGYGAVTADFMLFLIAFFFSGIIPKMLTDLLFIFGAFLLFYIAWKIKDARSKATTKRGNYMLGVFVGVTNPYQIAWWLTAGLFLLVQFSLAAVVGLFAAAASWATLFPIVISGTKHLYNSAVVPRISAAFLVLFGALMLYTGITAIA